MGWENEKSNFGITKHRELLCLLQEPSSALAEGDLPVNWVLDPPHLNLSSSHWFNNHFFFFFSLLYLRSSMVFLICFASSADNLPLVWTSFEAVAIPLYLPLKLLPKLLCLQWRLMPYRPSWNLFHYEKNMCVYIYIFLYCIWYMDVCVCAHVFVYYININVQGHYNIS